MDDDKGDSAKKPIQQQQQKKLLQVSSSSKNQLDQESSEKGPHHQQPSPVVTSGAPLISNPLYLPIGATPSSAFEQHFEAVNPKRQRYNTTTTTQWKLLPSPTTIAAVPAVATSTPQAHNQQASSSDTGSSPRPHSPIPSLSGTATTVSGQETSKPEFHQTQFRKGKYVSPVWKPNEMLWLARAWRIQYQGGGSEGSKDLTTDRVSSVRGKTRADKDREVAEYLQMHGVNRDAKTAGTKWDNMLGEFRKVYEWERGGEREQVGKSYFRLSPYERKIHRLPASFDEEVFEELSQFMGPRMRTSQSRGGAAVSGEDNIFSRPTLGSTTILPPPPYPKEDDFPLSGRAKQLTIPTGGEACIHGGRGNLLGFDTSSSLDIVSLPTSTSSTREVRRIGKIRMTWEESVNLWAEDGENRKGRIRVEGSSFLNADEIAFFDDANVACNMEAFEEGSLKGFSVDRFVSGQQVKVFGRRKSSSSVPAPAPSAGYIERVHLSSAEPYFRSINPQWEFQDPTDYYLSCLRVPPLTLPSLFELSWHLQEPPPGELRIPLRKDVYRDLPAGKELFFTTSPELLDCRAITYDILSPFIRNNPILTSSTATSRDSFIPLWDDCINRIVSKFCSLEMLIIRKPSSSSFESLQDQWPNVTGFIKNFCLWRGEEIDALKEGQLDPSSSIVEKLLWSYIELPYILGYYAVGHNVTFCALSRSQDRVIRTDLYSLNLTSPSERLKALIPCYRIGGILQLLADRCCSNNSDNIKEYPFSDFERINLGDGNIIEMTPNTVTRFFSGKRKWAAVKEIYDFLDHRIPHAESIYKLLEKDLGLVFKPRGCRIKPTNCEQLVEALKYVTKALVALHDLCFMHRDLSWERVMRRTDRDSEWFVTGFDEAVLAPQIYPHAPTTAYARGIHAPEMSRGLHGVKVDVWGVGNLVKTCGLTNVPKMLKELQNRCLEQNPEQRPTAADCYHHLLQLQSSLSASATEPY